MLVAARVFCLLISTSASGRCAASVAVRLDVVLIVAKGRGQQGLGAATAVLAPCRAGLLLSEVHPGDKVADP